MPIGTIGDEFELIDNVSEGDDHETQEEVRSGDKEVYLFDDDEKFALLELLK